uniref:SCP domain-containing protein n=1 Tax=Stomoxys calcitrans TaxID=35570 RepID=A0A1I8PNM4_STOCA
MAWFGCFSKKGSQDEPYTIQTNNSQTGALELTPFEINQNEGKLEEMQPLTHTEVKTKKSGNTVTVIRTTRTQMVKTQKTNQNSSTAHSSRELPSSGLQSHAKLVTTKNVSEESEPLTVTKVKRSKSGNTVTIVKTTRSRAVNAQNSAIVIERNLDEPMHQERVYKTTTEVKIPEKRTRFNLKSVLWRRAKTDVKTSEEDIESLQGRCLLSHNQFRELHGVKPLTLNKEMCDFAMEWAQHLAKKNKLKHRKKNKYGENLALGTGSSYNVEDAVQSWYDEMENYDYKKPGFSAQTGHFTQVVWQQSSQIGVGVAQKNDCTWVVCNYDPPGNVLGHYEENVQRPKGRKPKSQPLTVVGKAKKESVQDDPKPSTSASFIKMGSKKGKWSAFEMECLEAHNKRRALHGCAPLTLNKDLCSLATDWAKHLAKIRTMHHRPHNDYGENLYQLTNRDPTAEDAVKAWYNEISLYKYSKPSFSMATGHFTQVVWLDTTELGVGKAKVDNMTFVVCNYNPPGNVMGQYKSQVPPLGGFKENGRLNTSKDRSNDNNNQASPNEHSSQNRKSSFFSIFRRSSKAK